jgi:prepilin-type processing-associated H-X9-DG protein
METGNWHDRDDFRQYVGDSKGVFDCYSAKFRSNAAEPIAYWPNGNNRKEGNPPWNHNALIGKDNGDGTFREDEWTRLAELGSPSDLLNMSDCAQGITGRVNRSGGGKLGIHILNTETNSWIPLYFPSPNSHPNNPPNSRIGPMTPATENLQPDNYDYRRGALDFRHRNRMMAVMFDGHAAGIRNGDLVNKNVHDDLTD